MPECGNNRPSINYPASRLSQVKAAAAKAPWHRLCGHLRPGLRHRKNPGLPDESSPYRV